MMCYRKLDLIDHKRTGIISVLNEQCRLASSTDRSFANAAIDRCQGHSRFSCSKMQRGAGKFSIQHFAGPVEYSTADFIEKNKDELPQEGIELLFSSSSKFVASLGSILSCLSNASVNCSKENFHDNGSGTASSNNKSSSLSRPGVCAQFSVQLRELRERIERTSPHYVRCLKPNELLLPNRFDPCIIADQLRCAGVLEAIRVSRVGFPQRYLHDSFVSRYFMLASNKELKEATKVHRTMTPCEVFVGVVANKIKGSKIANVGQSFRSKLIRSR
jgi:myosin-5